jgi:hypothetical protein
MEVASMDDELAREVAERLATPIAFDAWRPMIAGATYMAPRESLMGEDGGVDVVVHFNAGQMADKEWRRSGMAAVIVSASYGSFGSTAYREAFADPARFGTMLDDLMRRLQPELDAKIPHVRRLALVAWSAGYAAIDMILREPRYYGMVDSVVLLDGLHTDYVEGHRVDEAALASFVRFARDAAEGSKSFVVSHSSIIPPNYASTTETAEVLCRAADATRIDEARRSERGMDEIYRADRGDLHVLGFKGDGPKDHIAQLYVLGDLMRTYVVPRWIRMDLTTRAAARVSGGAVQGAR